MLGQGLPEARGAPTRVVDSYSAIHAREGQTDMARQATPRRLLLLDRVFTDCDRHDVTADTPVGSGSSGVALKCLTSCRCDRRISRHL